MKTVLTALVVTLAALAFAPIAAAHVGANPGEAAASSFAMISFRVPHGCEESPTTSLTIRLPEGIVAVTPQAVPGWTVTTKMGKLAKPVDLHGEMVTEAVKQVTWRGGRLDAHQFADFGISMRMPETPGKTLRFPTIQRCAKGQTAWVQRTVEGQPEPDRPAPTVTLTEAAADGHGAAEDAMTTETTPTEETAAPAASSSSGDEDLSNAEMAALGMGGAGLVAGVAGLVVATRRRPRA